VAIAIKAISPRTRVVAVEPELAGDLAEGFRRGERVVWDPALTGRTVAVVSGGNVDPQLLAQVLTASGAHTARQHS
jgi:threonine dehydratase